MSIFNKITAADKKKAIAKAKELGAMCGTTVASLSLKAKALRGDTSKIMTAFMSSYVEAGSKVVNDAMSPKPKTQPAKSAPRKKKS